MKVTQAGRLHRLNARTWLRNHRRRTDKAHVSEGVQEHRRVLKEEAKETSGVTSALLLAYLDKVGGQNAVEAVLRRCGLEGCEDELRDENTWFSWETKIALFEATAEVLDRPDFMAEMAAHAMDANVAGALKLALRTLGSPQFVFRNIVRANARFVRSHLLELLDLQEGHATLRFSEIGGGRRHHRLDCEYTAGLLARVPELFGLPAAEVNHGQCSATGAEACIFELRWQERPATGRYLTASAVVTAAATTTSALLLPLALPFVALSGAAVGGVIVREHLRWRAEQWRHLKRQADDSEQVTERLFASLQDLVSDLRLDEVVAKVTRHAHAAVGGREFLLLVREGDGLICQSSSGLSGHAIAAVEAWANASAGALEGSLLVDDVVAEPRLELLARMENPLCSLASAPLNVSGEPLGLLVALGGQQRMFLPRDVSVLESYAAQVAIALANARRYQSEQSLAARDPLTGLLNHRSFHEAVTAELQRCSAEDFHSSIVLIDLDNFKQVNDDDGHAAGDRVLRAAAHALEETCRREDLAFRVGGDEFALLLPRVEEADAIKVAERACAAIGQIDGRMGASAGVVCATPQDPDKDALIARADRRLYARKCSSASRREPGPTPGTRQLAIDALVAALELHDRATAHHCNRVEELAVLVAERLGMDHRGCELVRQTAQLHDLGKLAVPEQLLNKPGRLSPDEWDVVRRHPIDGAELLLRATGLRRVAAAVRSSHERWDGQGYPDGLRGKDIPLAARVVAACDAFEAMTSDRPYRAAMDQGAALAELQACAGSQFDPDVVSALVTLMTSEVVLGERALFTASSLAPSRAQPA
jgi:diguanylate cyclase (GGDEF)-like protein